MNRPTRIYLLVIVVAAVAWSIGQPWANLVGLTSEQWVTAFTFAALGILSDVLAFSYPLGNGKVTSSIGFIALFASSILLPSPSALAIGIAVYTASQVVHRRPLLKASFNVAQVAVSLMLAQALYETFGGRPGAVQTLTALDFAGLVGAFFFCNQLLVSVAFALMGSEKVSRTFAKNVGLFGANLLYDVLVSPLAVIVVYLYSRMGMFGLVVTAFPLFLARHSYLAYQRLLQTNRDLLRVLIKAIETRDPYTSGHSVRVAQLAKAIAEDIGLSPSKVDEVETAALVHDIGKVDSIYAEIIQKGAGLTEAERRVIVTHAAKGAEFLRTLASFKPFVISAVRHHHERYDGTGYPDRLRGEEIPLPARIIMICDSIDAMLSDRPYRKALSIEQVRAELLRCSGSQFDPKIVNEILQRSTLEKASALVTPPPRPVPHLSVAV
jgi:putative nucleotidyltransferase with HDIG domain